MAQWHQLPEESGQAYEAFQVFKRLPAGKRSCRKAHALIESESILPTVLSSVFDWHKRFRWAERARAWDAHVVRKQDTALTRELVAKRPRTERNRLVARDLATSHALKVLRKLESQCIDGLDERQLLATLQAARAALGTIGISAIDHADQLRERLAKEGGTGPAAIVVGQSPEELLDLPEIAGTLQLECAEAKSVLESASGDMPGGG